MSAASQARKAQEDKDSEEAAAKTAADGPLDSVVSDENATPAVAADGNATVRPGNETETPFFRVSDTVGVSSPNGSFSTSATPTPRFPSLGKTRSSFGGSFSTAKKPWGRDAAAAAESRRLASSAALRRGLGRLFLEAGRVGAKDYFGDVELTRKIAQPASAVTTEPTRCFVLNKWDMLKRVERDVVRRFRANKAKSLRFLGDDDAVLAEFKRAMVWDRYRNSLVEEVVEGKRNGGR